MKAILSQIQTQTPRPFGWVALALVVAALSGPGCRSDQKQTERQPKAMGMGGGWGTPPAFVDTSVAQFTGFHSPTRLALAADGALYVSDTRRGMVVKLSQAGDRLSVLRGVQRPLGVALFEPLTTSPTMTVCEICLPRKAARQSGRCLKLPQKGNVTKRKWCRTVPAVKPRVYVGDAGDGSVRIFQDGRIIGALGSGPGEFGKPNAVAVTAEGLVYVVDSVQQAIKVYGHDGAAQGSFGGALDFPTDLVIREDLGRIFVSDFGTGRLVVYDLNGQRLREIWPPLNSAGDPVFKRPAGLGTGPKGRLYVVDNLLAAVAVLDVSGNLVDTIGYQHQRYWTGELSVPVDAVAGTTRVFVSSNKARRISVFEVAP